MTTNMASQPESADSPKLLLTARQAAVALSISERLLWSLANEGRIKVTRINRSVRYSVDALRAFVDEQSRA